MTLTLDGATWSIHELPLFDNYACHYALGLQRELEPPHIHDPLANTESAPIAEPAGEPQAGLEPGAPPTIELHELTPAHWLALTREPRPF